MSRRNYEHEGPRVAAQLHAGLSLTAVVQDLLVDRFSPVKAVRSIREGAALGIDTALELVADQLDPEARLAFQEIWSSAREWVGNSLDDLDEAFPAAEDNSEMSGQDIDLDEACETLALERLRATPRTELVAWCGNRLATAPYRAGGAALGVVYVGLDTLGCPAELVPPLLHAAELEDASSCQWPLRAILNSFGAEPVLARMAVLESGDGAGRSKAAQWRYQLRSWASSGRNNYEARCVPADLGLDSH